IQIFCGQREKFCECPVAILDAEDCSIHAVLWPAIATGIARMTGRVDLAGDALAIPFTDEFVSRNSGERVVAVSQLHVGIANSGDQHADESFVGWRLRLRDVSMRKPPILQPQRAHRGPLTRSEARSQPKRLEFLFAGPSDCCWVLGGVPVITRRLIV